MTGRRIGGLAGILAALAVGLGACDRRIEPYVPGEEPEEPDLSRIFPPGAQRAEQATGQVPPPGRGPRGAPPLAAERALPIAGTIALSDELSASVPDGAILFLIARTGSAGPPLAVQRIPSPSFPLDFSIGPDDRMIEAMPFSGALTLTARVDSDGNAMTRTPGDLQGAAPGTYEPGASGVSLLIDEIL